MQADLENGKHDTCNEQVHHVALDIFTVAACILLAGVYPGALAAMFGMPSDPFVELFQKSSVATFNSRPFPRNVLHALQPRRGR